MGRPFLPVWRYSMGMGKKELVVIYELKQLPEVLAYLGAHPGARIVCLNFWIGRELRKRGVSFIALREFLDVESTEEEWWLLAQDIAREWYRLPAMKFFEYKGIRIGEALEPMMEAYLSKLFYYVRIYMALKDAYPEARFYIPAPLVQDAPTVGPLIFLERWTVVDAARMAGLGNVVQKKHVIPSKHMFPRTAWKSLLVRVYNAIIDFAPRRGLKIYTSEYWSHIAPIITQMDDAELVLMESSELKNISWRQIFKHRIRIRHPAEATNESMKRAAIKRSVEFMGQWKAAGRAVNQFLIAEREGLDWSPVLEACEYLITYSSRVIADVDALRGILRDEKPYIILQRASIGGRQHHFFLMARVAAQLNIPSIELQHAGAYIDPRSVHSRIETDYLATYGTYTNSWYKRIGYAYERLIPIGSPRFDRAALPSEQMLDKGRKLFERLGLNLERPVLLVAVPFSDATISPTTLDSYELATFFKDIRTAQEHVLGLQILFKFRDYTHVGATRKYLQELFPADSAIAGNEDLFALLCASDAAVSGNSTVIYEALLAQKPLVLYPWKRFDTHHTQMYASAATLARSADELRTMTARIFEDPAYRDILLAQGRRFLEGYSFDGRSAERMRTLLQKK